MPILSQTLPSIPHDDSETVLIDQQQNCSNWPCRTTLTGSRTAADRTNALSRNQDPTPTLHCTHRGHTIAKLNGAIGGRG